ncbi:MAG: hypothetical protein L6Q37_05700 [Bdellovibrionaceae bacterium]|nr:hypothetical protein [Pseudobdellovibrionaceae bacterium]NUM57854.1 hypothetical protein [Pseudobdellovibrionaceae bacterium]
MRIGKKMWFQILALFFALNQPTFSQENSTTATPQQNQKIDNKLLQQFYRDDLSPIFEDIVSVQKKAKQKSGKILIYPFYSIDFSDTPYTMWAPNLNLGYAFGEFIEVYLNLASGFSNSERFISKKVKELTLETGDKAEIKIQKAKMQVGIELNWSPVYGKDSWGPYGIIRSDTFLNFGAYNIAYEKDSGLKFKMGIGKTFYLSKTFNLRLVGSLSSIQFINDTEKVSNIVGLFEGGFVFYL